MHLLTTDETSLSGEGPRRGTNELTKRALELVIPRDTIGERGIWSRTTILASRHLFLGYDWIFIGGAHLVINRVQGEKVLASDGRR